MANGFLQLANTDLGTFVSQVLLLTSLGWGTSSLLKVSNLIPTVISQFKNFGSVLTTVTSGASSVSSALAGLTKSGTVLSGIFSSALPVILGVSAAIVGVIKLVEWYKESNPSLEEAMDTLENLNSQLDSNTQKIQEINNLPWHKRTPEILEEKEALEEENKELEKQIELYEERAAKDAKKTLSQGGLVDTGKTVFRVTDVGESGNISWLGEEYDYLSEELKETFKELGITVEEVKTQIWETADVYEQYLIEQAKEYIEILETEGSLTDEQIQEYNTLNAELADRSNAYKALGEDTNELVVVQEQLSDAYDAATSNAEKQTYALKLNSNEYEVLIAKLPILKTELKNIGDGFYELNNTAVDAANSLIQADGRIMESSKEKAQEVLKDIELIINGYLQLYRLLREEKTEDGQLTENAKLALIQYENAVQAKIGLLEAIQRSEQLGYSSETNIGASSGSGSASTKQLTDIALENFKIYYKDLQHLRDIDEIDEEEYLDALRILVDNYTSDATANMKKYGTDTETIARNMYQYEEELVDGWKQLQEERVEAAKEAQEKIIENLQEEQSIYEKFFSYMTDRIQDQIEDLQEEYNETAEYWDDRIAAVQKENEELERQISLQQKLEALARAEQTQVLVYKEGQFQYVQDVDAVNEAQTELEAYERDEALRQEVENLEQLKDQALQSIQDQIDGWEDYKEEWSSVVDHYQEEQDRLLLEQELGIELEGENWKNRLENLDGYISEYEALMERITRAQENLNALSSGSLESSSSGGGRFDSDGKWHLESGSGGGGGWTEAEMEEGFHRAPSSSSGGSGSGGSSNNDDWYSSEDYDVWGQTSWTNRNKYASGTLSASGGISLVGENGPELRVLNSGDGIISANATKNLMNWSKISPIEAMNKSVNYSFNIGDIVLPNVNDYNSFIQQLKTVAYQRAFKRA